MLFILSSRQIINTFRKASVIELTRCLYKTYTNIHYTNRLISIETPAICESLVSIRYKHKKSKKQEELTTTDDEETDELDNDVSDKYNKILNVKVNSLRADLLLKAGLGIARNKIETMFYESKIRVNGQKLLKKGEVLSVGDEIDVIKGNSPTNPDFLIVARVEILSATERGEGFSVKLRRNKGLIVENYTNEHAWKG